ncbi:MAG: hypothetical protein K2M97_06155 [Muribaculaceae bacterium]|nr:hypothetical protein [Muribaculaceae bacterium]
MDTIITSSSRRIRPAAESGQTSGIVTGVILTLSIVAAAVAATYFAIVRPEPLGLYGSLAVVALCIDPMRRRLQS